MPVAARKTLVSSSMDCRLISRNHLPPPPTVDSEPPPPTVDSEPPQRNHRVRDMANQESMVCALTSFDKCVGDIGLDSVAECSNRLVVDAGQSQDSKTSEEQLEDSLLHLSPALSSEENSILDVVQCRKDARKEQTSCSSKRHKRGNSRAHHVCDVTEQTDLRNFCSQHTSFDSVASNELQRTVHNHSMSNDRNLEVDSSKAQSHRATAQPTTTSQSRPHSTGAIPFDPLTSHLTHLPRAHPVYQFSPAFYPLPLVLSNQALNLNSSQYENQYISIPFSGAAYEFPYLLVDNKGCTLIPSSIIQGHQQYPFGAPALDAAGHCIMDGVVHAAHTFIPNSGVTGVPSYPSDQLTGNVRCQQCTRNLNPSRKSDPIQNDNMSYSSNKSVQVSFDRSDERITKSLKVELKSRKNSNRMSVCDDENSKFDTIHYQFDDNFTVEKPTLQHFIPNPSKCKPESTSNKSVDVSCSVQPCVATRNVNFTNENTQYPISNGEIFTSALYECDLDSIGDTNAQRDMSQQEKPIALNSTQEACHVSNTELQKPNVVIHQEDCKTELTKHEPTKPAPPRSWAALFSAKNPQQSSDSASKPAHIKVANTFGSVNEADEKTHCDASNLVQTSNIRLGALSKVDPHKENLSVDALSLATKSLSLNGLARAPPSNKDSEDNPNVNLKLGSVLKRFECRLSAPALTLRGLFNSGNYCYVNCVIQSLIACPLFYNLISRLPQLTEKVPHRPDSSKGNEKCTDISSAQDLTEQCVDSNSTPPLFLSHIKTIFSNFIPMARTNTNAFRKSRSADVDRGSPRDLCIGQPLDLTNFHYVVDEFMNKTVQGSQEDAHEFLCRLLQILNLECARCIKLTTQVNGECKDVQHSVQQVDMKSSEDSEQDAEWQEYYGRKVHVHREVTTEESPISEIFGGCLRTHLERSGLDRSVNSSNMEPFYSLSLDVECPSILQALRNMGSRTPVSGLVNPTTNKPVQGYQKMLIERLPPCLILHLKCFSWKDGQKKIMQRQIIPVDLAIPNEIMSKTSTSPRNYKLFAIIHHIGRSIHSGHYLCDVFHPGIPGWLRCDDKSVSHIHSREVMGRDGPSVLNGPNRNAHNNITPFMLFYRQA